MRILVEIVHPANVLFFMRPIRAFLERGDEVMIASRHKDVACKLLDQFGLPHEPLSTAGSGVLGLGLELIGREFALWRLVRRFRPQVMMGFGGVAITHIGRLTGVPAIVYYDTEHAKLQNTITWPFVRSLTVPEDYFGPTPKGRTRRIPGVKEMSFFHPSSFKPDRDVAIAAGYDPDRKNVLIRMVSWGANHDIGKSSFMADMAERLVVALGSETKLHVSAESDMPPALTPHIWRGKTSDIHHLMAHCDALVGESATMASEAAVMGVPSLYAGVDFAGYTKGFGRRGLIKLVTPDEQMRLPEIAATLLEDRTEFDAAYAELLRSCPDWAEDIVSETDRLARAPW